MFLAWNEIKHSKGRYALITGVIFLIAYLVFFLTGLAFGLAQEGRMAADNWKATAVVLTKDANKSLSASQINQDDMKEIKAKEKAPLLQSASVIQVAGKESTKDNVTLFGVNPNQFLAPHIVKGRIFDNNKEVVIDESLAKVKNYHVGDKVKFTGDDTEMKIVGMTSGNMFNIAPTVYMSQKAFRQVKQVSPTMEKNVNAIVVRATDNKIDNIKVHNSDLEVVSMKDFINNLPGYSAQVMTFTFMIGFLILIAAIVIGIFIYVLTMQKKQVFGVMKVQGISTGFIAKSVVMQTFMLAVTGVVLGFVITIVSGLMLPAAVPFQLNLPLMSGVAILMLIIAVLGSVFSVRSIAKIDPLKALN